MTRSKKKETEAARIRRLERRVLVLAGEAAASIAKEKADVRKAGGAFVCRPLCRLCRIAATAEILRKARAGE